MTEGKLFVVATPIGNLKDITLRALEVLKECDCILSEDTRETDKLFREYGLSTPQMSYRDQNHTRIISTILEMLKSGKKLALVCDSGTPALSDPGFKLINDVISAGIDVQAIPGPSSITTALSVSGLPTDKFTFLGFLPKSSAQRTKLLSTYGTLDSTLVIFESPFRIVKLLQEIKDTLGDRHCAVLAELTKIYERVYRGTTSELLASISKKDTRGEFVVMIAKENY